MKRLLYIFLIITTFFLFSACKSTPKDTAVQSKNNGELERALGQKEVTFIPTDYSKIYETYNCKSKLISVTIDAELDIPTGITALPVVEGTASTVSVELLKSALKASMNGKTVYDPPYEESKRQIQEKLNELEKQMTDEHLYEYYDGDEEMISYAKEIFKTRHEAYVKAYKNAKEDVDLVESEFSFKPASYYMSSSEREEELADLKAHGEADIIEKIFNVDSTYYGVSYQDDGYINGVYAYNSTDERNRESYVGFVRSKFMDVTNNAMPMSFKNISDTYDMTFPCTIKETTAIQYGNNLINRLGLKDFGLSETSMAYAGQKEKQKYWKLIFRRALNNVVSCRIEDGYAEYRPTYGDEYIEMCITDEGVMEWVYRNMININRTINNGVSTKSFDEILSIYKDYSSIAYDLVYSRDEDINDEKNVVLTESETAEIVIDSIKLSYVRIAEKDKKLTYLFVPAYIFSGEEIFYNSTDVVSKKMVLHMINAIDGSIISADDCY